MLPRLIYRTHYQAIGLDLIDLVVMRALSATKSETRWTAASRISHLVSGAMRPFNPAAAAYLLDEITALGLCNRNYVLSAPAAGYAAAGGDQGTNGRLWFYLFHLLAADGAMLVELLQMLLQKPQTLADIYDSDDFDSLLLRIYEFYLLQSPDLRDKLSIRSEIKRLTRTAVHGGAPGLQAKTRKHKVMFHAQALIDVGMLNDREDRMLTVTSRGRQLLGHAPDLSALEAILRSESKTEGLVQSLCGFQDRPALSTDIIEAYAHIKAMDIPLIAIDSIYSAINVQIAQGNQLISRKSLELCLDEMRLADPSHVHIFSQPSSEYGSIQLDPPPSSGI